MNDTKTLQKLPQELTDLSKPSLHALSYALRHPDTWPKDFYWDYGTCDTCAIGLTLALWSSIEISDLLKAKELVSVMANTFAMPYKEANSIFMGQGKWAPERKLLWFNFGINHDAITPDMVADQIDEYLRRAE